MPTPCPGCNKFAALETSEPEWEQEPEIDEDGLISGTVRVVRESQCCGEEMKETTFEVSQEASYTLEEHIQAHRDAGEEYTLEVEENGLEATEEMQTKDRHGNPIRNYRYMKTLIGYTGTVSITCSCGYTEELVLEDSTPASSFDELV